MQRWAKVKFVVPLWCMVNRAPRPVPCATSASATTPRARVCACVCVCVHTNTHCSGKSRWWRAHKLWRSFIYNIFMHSIRWCNSVRTCVLVQSGIFKLERARARLLLRSVAILIVFPKRLASHNPAAVCLTPVKANKCV